jgi:ribose 5-phosphate isomerase A
MEDQDQFKKRAAEKAVEFVESGMVLGLGHGSTVQFALEALARRLQSGEIKDIVGVPCSKKTEDEAQRLDIPLTDLSEHKQLDLTLDGADEVDRKLNLIKGGGAALLREKIVAQASRREIIMVDESKLSEKLGTKHSLPVEIVQFGWERQVEYVDSLGGKATLRKSGDEPVLSDQLNFILDCDFGPIKDLEKLARSLESRSGIVEHGLFLGLATDVIVAGPAAIHHLTSKK